MLSQKAYIFQDITLRPAIDADVRFVNGLLFVTMHKHVEETWPHDLETHEHYYAINACNLSNTQIIEYKGLRIGRLSTTVRNNSVFVDEIHILPKYQCMGIASHLIRQIFETAAAQSLPVELTVLKTNPAQNLYRKLGFKTVEEKNHRLYMQYLPVRQAKAA